MPVVSIPSRSPALARQQGCAGRRGFTMIEVLLAVIVLGVAAMAAVMHVTRSTQDLGFRQDQIQAQTRALAILNELRGHASGFLDVAAADLTQFDDGDSYNPTMSILRDPLRPGEYVAPDHPVSDNAREEGVWRWTRRITIDPVVGGADVLDKRLCTVRVYRRVPAEEPPGTMLAEVSALIQTAPDTKVSRQVFDLYVLALENHPGTGVDVDARRAVLASALGTLSLQSPGLAFRVHWITKAGFGRDDEYAPYVNEGPSSTDPTVWTYVYPGRLPALGGPLPERFYDAAQFRARMNVDGTIAPAFVNGYSVDEPFADANGNGVYDDGEVVTDLNADGVWTPGNVAPYALADQHNHCVRWPEAVARFGARVAAGTDSAEEPTWRLLLDRMAASPQEYRNALILNLHGEVLPVPPVRNYSDACKAPDFFPGWRAVTHPERLHATRVAGDDALSVSPRFRVHAWKASFENAEPLTTQEEPFVDADANGVYDAGESYEDWNGNGVWDAGVPITLVVPGGDFTWAVNDPGAPSLVLRNLAGGIDADGNGAQDPYADWSNARRYPERYTDANGDGRHNVSEPWLDLNGNGLYDLGEAHQEIDGNGTWTATTEPLVDGNGNARRDAARPAERFTDANGNGRWDAAEPYWDRDGNGAWTPPAVPATPWKPWDPAAYGNAAATQSYIDAYGEPFVDLDGDGTYDAAEAFVDGNANGVWDGGFARGEMWFEAEYDAAARRTILSLYGTPLEAPADAAGRGLAPGARLYDMDYVPCPTPAAANDPDRFGRDLYEAGAFPKNTARWTLEIPTAALRRALASGPGANDGDAADHVLQLETRFTADLGAGTAWPVKNSPANLSTTYVYCYASADSIPFSERFQFLGDPRHCPYADLDATGTTQRNGYNPYFDDFRTDGDNQAAWPAFSSALLEPGWMGRTDADVPRFLAWVREALTTSECVFASTPGSSFRYLSLGGDVGFAAGGPGVGVPMAGTPFGRATPVEENTLVDAGTLGVGGTRKYVRTNAGGPGGLRAGGYWWSKPWLGELAPDAAYATQWSPWGNLRAAEGATEHRMVGRGDITAAQQPAGTRLGASRAELGDEGCTSFFHAGTAGATFHHRQVGEAGILVAEGVPVAGDYGLTVPGGLWIAKPFQLDWAADGGVGPEFAFPLTFPRCTAELGPRFVAADATPGSAQGCAAVRLTAPGGGPTARILVNGMDGATGGGSSFFTQWTSLTLAHTYFAEGLPGTPRAFDPLPRVTLEQPSGSSSLLDPASVTLEWDVEWRRFDGQPYTPDYDPAFAGSDAALLYVPMYSRDGGRTWTNMRDGSPATAGVLPRSGGAPDPGRTLADQVPGGPEQFTWGTPAASFPAGKYVVRIEAYRTAAALHHGHLEVRFDVTR